MDYVIVSVYRLSSTFLVLAAPHLLQDSGKPSERGVEER